MVQPYAAMLPVVALFENAEMLELCLADVARLGLPLWSVSLMDPAAMHCSQREMSPTCWLWSQCSTGTRTYGRTQGCSRVPSAWD